MATFEDLSMQESFIGEGSMDAESGFPALLKKKQSETK